MEEHYERDRWRKIRGSQEYDRECVVCGSSFKTWRPGKKTCSDECKEVNEKARKRDREKKRSRAYDLQKERERAILRRYGSEENHKKHILELEQKRQQMRLEKEAQKEAKRIRGRCVVCGNEFLTFNPMQKTCCKECGKKYNYARKEKRIPKSQIVDRDITLEALYRRDSGVCYICGEKCDWGDRNEKMVGARYPSIDHVIPVSKGGLHAWSNVKLAHMICNATKRDRLLEAV